METAPSGAVIGVIGDNESVKRLLASRGRFIGLEDPLDLSPAPAIAVFHRLALEDSVGRFHAATALDRLRRAGSTVFLASHEEDLLLRLSDEIWWVEDGALLARGDPGETIETARRRAAERIRSQAAGHQAALSPSMRRGDGRARLLAIDLLDGRQTPTMVWRSGESAAIRVTVRFESDVEQPVVGIMIRTRVGMEVYGTNTELERVQVGPCRAGELRRVTFAFSCDLCPNEYTVTAASHDPDGVWHDWLEDAVAFSVTDSRYTAGVANLRARVTVISVPE